MKFSRLQKKWLLHLIGPAVVLAAVWWAGPEKVWAILSKADPTFIAAAIVLTLPMALIKGIRWRLLLDSYDIKLSFADSTSMYATGMFFSAVTPGRIGDLVKIAMLIKRGYSTAKSVACNIIDRLFDVGMVLLAGYAGMVYFSAQFAKQLKIVNISGGVALVLFVLLVAKRHLIKKMAAKLVPDRYHSVAGESWNEIAGGLSKGRIGHQLLLVMWTVLFWAIYFTAIYLCGVAVGIHVSFFYISGCAAVAMLLSMLPITVAGAGTRDAVFVLLLGQIGIVREQCLAFSALVLTLFLLNCAIFYLISVIFKPKEFSTD